MAPNISIKQEEDGTPYVHNEVGREEFINALVAVTGLKRDDAETAVRGLPIARAMIMEQSLQFGDNARVEIHDDLIMHGYKVPETDGHGVAEGHKVEAHFKVFTKCHKGQLNELHRKLGQPVKNG